MNKYLILLFFLFLSAKSFAQKPYALMQSDTTIGMDESIRLCVDSARAYSNFMFAAKNPATNLWVIWRKSLATHKYTPVFTDQYNRLHVVASADHTQMIYVRYKTPDEDAMRNATLDSAWICRGSTNGTREEVIFQVPEFHKNAVYDLDWSRDKEHILLACGNDQYPNLTRDGDIFEYELKTGTITNRTHNWELWSNHCAYAPDGKTIAYSHYANFTSAIPTDIFIQQADGTNRQITNTQQYTNTFPYCTLTGFTGDKVIYRRGQYYDNSLFEKGMDGEQQLTKIQGFGGIHLDDSLYAATDLKSNIYLFTHTATLGNIHIAGINNFAVDNAYNVDNNLNTHLCWLGKQNVKVRWSTGDTTFSIVAHPATATTYYCTVTDNNRQYTDSIHINVIAHTATDLTAAETDSLNKVNNQIQILPDPTSSIVHILSPKPVNLSVWNEQGNTLLQKKDAHEIDMSTFTDGNYLIILTDENGIKLKIRKIVLRR